jgi:uncharacterized protein with HEPN domain
LAEFLDIAREAEELIVTPGREQFLDDRTRQLAAEAIMNRLGEIVARLPQDFLAQHPQIPWRAIRGMRNVVAHRYHVIDYQIVWTALAQRLPADATLVSEILARRRSTT